MRTARVTEGHGPPFTERQKMTNLVILQTPHRLREKLYADNRIEAVYTTDEQREAIPAILEGLDALRGSAELVDALFSARDLCELATAIHGLHMAESDDISDDEARAILEGLYNSQQPEAVRKRAGEMLRDLAGRTASA